MFNLFTHRRTKQREEDRKRVEDAQAQVQKRKNRDCFGSFEERGGGSRVTEGGTVKFKGTGLRDIYLRRYLPAAIRAEMNAKEFTSGHMANDEPYNPLSPNLHYAGRSPSSGKPVIDPRPKPSNQIAAVRINLTINQQRRVPHEPPTMGAAFKPVFRVRDKDKEIDFHEFRPYNKEYHQEAAWSTPTIYTSEPYIDGFEVLGNNLRQASLSPSPSSLSRLSAYPVQTRHSNAPSELSAIQLATFSSKPGLISPRN